MSGEISKHGQRPRTVRTLSPAYVGGGRGDRTRCGKCSFLPVPSTWPVVSVHQEHPGHILSTFLWGLKPPRLELRVTQTHRLLGLGFPICHSSALLGHVGVAPHL